MAEEKKITRVQFFYEDNTSKFVDGLELERWNGFLSQVCVMAAARGMNPEWSKVKWKETTAPVERVLPEVLISETEILQEGIVKEEKNEEDRPTAN